MSHPGVLLEATSGSKGGCGSSGSVVRGDRMLPGVKVVVAVICFRDVMLPGVKVGMA